jgi:hypothetical protein
MAARGNGPEEMFVRGDAGIHQEYAEGGGRRKKESGEPVSNTKAGWAQR